MQPLGADPLVSAIVPAYNAERWIGATLESVLAQTHRNIELIVVDNGSTDRTVEVVRHTAPHARLLTAAVRGPSAARNVGIDAARGAFIQFVDADDVIDPRKVERHVAAALASGADVVWGGYSRMYPRPEDGEFVAAKLIVPALDPDDLLASFIRAEGFLPVGAALFRRAGSVAEQRFDEGRLVVEDVDYMIRLYRAGASFVQSDAEAGLKIREHDSPMRASRTTEPVFWASCAENARRVRDAWRAAGEPLSPARVAAVADVWLAAAEVFVRHRHAELDRVLSDLRELDPDYSKRLRQPHRTVARVLGYRAAFALAERVKRLRPSITPPPAEGARRLGE